MKHLLYIIVLTFFITSCCHTQSTNTSHTIQDSVYYNVVVKDTTVYHHISADTLKATHNVNLDIPRLPKDTISVLSNNYSTSIVELTRKSRNEFLLNHFLFQKKLAITVPVKFVYLDKYVTKYEKIIDEKIVVKYKRDKIFWGSICLNILFILFLIIKKRIGI